MRRLSFYLSLAIIIQLLVCPVWAATVSFQQNVSNSDNGSICPCSVASPVVFGSTTCQAVVIWWVGQASKDAVGWTATVPDAGLTLTRQTAAEVPYGEAVSYPIIVASGVIQPGLSGSHNVTVAWSTSQIAFWEIEIFNNVSGFSGATKVDSNTTAVSNESLGVASSLGDMTITANEVQAAGATNVTTNQTLLFGPLANTPQTSGKYSGDRGPQSSGTITHTWTLASGTSAGFTVSGLNVIQGSGGACSAVAGPGPGWLPNLGVGMWVPHSIWSRRLRHTPIFPWGIR